MKRIALTFAFVSLFLLSHNSAFAQVLDDEDEVYSGNSNGELSFDETDKNEELFNEMFGEHLEKEKNELEKLNSFEDAAEQTAKILKESDALENTGTGEDAPRIPLEGNMFIGVNNGSFKIFQTMSGRMNCSFSVTLKSNLNKDIRLLGLSLIYPQRGFAFVFRDVPANKSQVRYITTGGDICYNLAGVPDIDINLCKIKGAASKECALRLKWDEKMRKPETED